MSLFPGIDSNIATITQPSLTTTNQTYFGKRILKSASKCGLLPCGRIRTMYRYFYSFRRKQFFWLAIGCFLSLFIYFTYFVFLIPQISSGNIKIEENTMSSGNVVRRSLDVVEELPDIPVKRTIHRPQQPLLLHYLWCGQRVFEFRHFLAIKSASNVIRPNKILFHFVDLPLMDREGYFVWFNETLKAIPDIVLNRLDRSSCPVSGANRFNLILQILSDFKGIYLPDDMIMLDFPWEITELPFASNILSLGSEDFQEGILYVKEKNFEVPQSSRELDMLLAKEYANRRKINDCVDLNLFERSNRKIMCFIVTKLLFPRDIWHSNSKFTIISKALAYNTISIRPENDLNDPIPRIAHYICSSDCEINFLFFVSVMSSIFVARLDRVYIHGSIEPNDKWWLLLQQYSKVVFVQHPYNSFDLPQRFEILQLYGGIYLDTNVLWTQKIPEYYFGYSVVVSPDWHLHGSWPDSINPSIVMSKQQSNYLMKLNSLLQASERPKWFVYHYIAYHILEIEPQIAFLSRHLQVKCLNHNCHPTWLRDYRSELKENKPGGAFNWRNDTLSVHWTDDNDSFDIDSVKFLSGMPVEIARFVFQAANINLNEL